MHASLDVGWLSAFLLALTRATAWVFVAPPFNTTGVPLKVKLGVAMSFAVFIAPHFHSGPVLMDSWAFLGAVLYEAAIGFAMGFGVLVLLSTFLAAGAFIDISAGFSASQLYDPFSSSATTPLARFYQTVATAVLFASNGHTLLVRGFLSSFTVAGQGDIGIEQVGRILAHNVSTFFGASLQMAVPLMAALFLAELGIGLVAKAAPQMNLLSISFAVKMGATILLGGLVLKVLPAILYPLVEQSADTMMALGR